VRNGNPQASTRVEILTSAAKAFRKLGYHGATVEQIAAALHMKKGNLYYYYKNKEEILFACHQYSLDRLMQLLDEIEASTLPADEKLRRLVHAFVHTILDELHGTALFLDLEALSPAHLKAVIVRRDRSVFAHVHPSGSAPMAAMEIGQRALAAANGATPPPMEHQHHAAALPPTVTFPYGFPATGDYRIFVQVKRQGRIETGAFDVRVE